MRNLILICLAIICICCDKEEKSSRDVEYADIIGKWRFSKMSGHVDFSVGADTIINPGDGCHSDNTIEFTENKTIKDYSGCNQTTEVTPLKISKEHLDKHSPFEPYSFSIEPKENYFPFWRGKKGFDTTIVLVVSCTKTTLVYREGDTFVTLKRVE